MSYIEESLSRGEEIHAIFRLHWLARVPMWLCFLFALPALALGLVPSVGVMLGPAAAGALLLGGAWQWLKLRSIEQGVTNKRVILKTGIISRHSEEMKLSSVETVEIRQSVTERLLGCGTVKVTGRGVSDVVFVQIDNPMDVKRRIESVERQDD